MKSLESLLQKRKKELQVSLDEKDIFYVFRHIIKEEFGNIGASKFQPDYFGKKVLIVKCESSTWANELFLNQSRILRKMSEDLGEGIVEKIKTK